MFIRVRVRAMFRIRFRDRARFRVKVRAMVSRPRHEWTNTQIFANFSLQTFVGEYYFAHKYTDSCKT